MSKKRTLSKLAARAGLDLFFLRLRRWREEKIQRDKFQKVIRTGTISFPLSVTIEPTMRCNLHCFMCFQSAYRQNEKNNLSQKELTPYEWSDFFRKSRHLIKRVGLIGGEIFSRRDIFKIFDALEDLGIPFNFVTNGTMIDKKVGEKLLGYKFLDAVCFSVHGLGKTHDQIVGLKGSFKKVMGAIKIVRKKHFWVAVNCVISEKNLSEIPKLVEVSAALEADSVGFQLENFATVKEEKISRDFFKNNFFSDFIWSKKEEKYPYSFSSLKRAWGLARKMGRKKGIPVTFSPPVFYTQQKLIYSAGIRTGAHKIYCEELLSCRIDPEGNIVACLFLPQRFGNVKEESLREIWDSSAFKNYRRQLLTNNLVPICKRCCMIQINH